MYSKQVLAILKVFDHGERDGEREGETRAIPIGACGPKNHIHLRERASIVKTPTQPQLNLT